MVSMPWLDVTFVPDPAVSTLRAYCLVAYFQSRRYSRATHDCVEGRGQ